MKSASNLLTPSSTIFRVRRKRGADPLAGLVVSSSKRQRTEQLAPHEATNGTDDAAADDEKIAREIFFAHVGTSDAPGGKDAAQFLHREHKVVQMIDYDPAGNQVMEAAKAISNFGIEEQERRDFERESTAPLAAAELDEEDEDGLQPSTSTSQHPDYVYDFYYAADGQTPAMNDSEEGDVSSYAVRLPTDEELQLYFGGDDESDSDGPAADDDEDSNDENHYRNDYPDEDTEFGAGGGGDDCENDTTSDDDSYDHYGDEAVEYNGIYHE